MNIFSQKGYSFFKVLIILTILFFVLYMGVPSLKAFAGQTGMRACENNMKTITRLENEYFKAMGMHTNEYLNLDIVDKASALYIAGFLSEDDIECRQTNGQYQWRRIDGEIVLICVGHVNDY